MTSKPVVRSLGFALSEFLLIVLPVFMFVALEAARHEHFAWLWTSPEWSIATIFIVSRHWFLHYFLLHRTGRPLNEPILVLYSMGALLMIVGAGVNTWYSLGTNSAGAVIIRLLLLLVASVAFFVFVGGAYFSFTAGGGRANGS